MNHVMTVVWLDCESFILSFGSMPERQVTGRRLGPGFFAGYLRMMAMKHVMTMVGSTMLIHLIIWAYGQVLRKSKASTGLFARYLRTMAMKHVMTVVWFDWMKSSIS